MQITDFGLTLGVQDETSIFLVVNVSFMVASEESKKKKNAVILFWWKSIRTDITTFRACDVNIIG